MTQTELLKSCVELYHPQPGETLKLRRVVNMDSFELLHIADILISKFDSVKFRIDLKTKSNGEFAYWKVHREHRGYSKSFCIDEAGGIDVYDGDDLDVNPFINLAIAYMIKRRIDVFTLVELGLAEHLNYTST